MIQCNKREIECSEVWTAMNQRESVHYNFQKLTRISTLFEVTILSIGLTLGVGIYVLAGDVAHTDAGPAVILSFIVAAIASAMGAICYAEFAERMPKANSVYMYAYVAIGEFVAFVFGWNLSLEYIVGKISLLIIFL